MTNDQQKRPKSMPSDVASWLQSELDRVEQIAQAAAVADGPVWTYNPGDYWIISGSGGGPLVYDEGTPTGPQARHISLWDPQSVLRRVAADRRILAEHKIVRVLGWAADWQDSCAICGSFQVPCRTVRLLAEGYGWEEPQ
ncbi:hypothetical protein KV557_10060 [Kitasatospora aureofaciens]|uniref:DUF6221 family protein n=1 Tax=Kitasatospora aureofaciens TaxID=1894 RepID=UPI001C471D94|nr:DUF6221 family protein [Kitasatospora aureofaciens]MBV6697468.1 hypothetical protein [Kitasatospora aureofaciens]